MTNEQLTAIAEARTAKKQKEDEAEKLYKNRCKLALEAHERATKAALSSLKETFKEIDTEHNQEFRAIFGFDLHTINVDENNVI